MAISKKKLTLDDLKKLVLKDIEKEYSSMVQKVKKATKGTQLEELACQFCSDKVFRLVLNYVDNE